MFQIATAKHIDAILGLMREYYLSDGYPFDETTARAVEELIRNSDFGELWVATEGDQVVAYVAVTFGFSFEYGGRDAFIDELVVAPFTPGPGLGHQGPGGRGGGVPHRGSARAPLGSRAREGPRPAAL